MENVQIPSTEGGSFPREFVSIGNDSPSLSLVTNWNHSNAKYKRRQSAFSYTSIKPKSNWNLPASCQISSQSKNQHFLFAHANLDAYRQLALLYKIVILQFKDAGTTCYSRSITRLKYDENGLPISNSSLLRLGLWIHR